MNFLEAIQNRYTTKAYSAGYTIPSETIDQLREVLRLCPSSVNSQPWLFTIVDDAQVKAHYAELSRFNREKVLGASHLVLFSVYADVATFERERVDTLHEHAQGYYRSYVASCGEAAVHAWMARQVYVALGVLLSACAMMGIDSTPMEGIDTEAYTKQLGESKYRVLLAVALGRRSPDDPNRLEVTPKRRRADSVR